MDWQQARPRALDALRNVFGFEAFRGVQEQAVEAALTGRDAFVLMPTGGGKSLCYALPAAVTGGLVLVVSPLIALMQDQVAALQSKDLAADYLSSSRTAEERRGVLGQLQPAANAGGGGGRRLALLYVTPELLATDSFRQTLKALHTQCPGVLKLIAIDEAHCISQWGHDYRPTYRRLSQLRALLKGVPCMALTATATSQVQQDILSSLKLHQPALLTTSFNRPNISYDVVLLDVQPAPHAARAPNAAAVAAAGAAGGVSLAAVNGDEDGLDADDADHAGYAHLLQLVKPPAWAAGQQQQQQQQWPGPVTIVYALKRTAVDAVARRLRAEGVAAAAYHAALPAATRADVLARWNAGRLQVVVASVAFGMGVDKADIALVVHYNLPRSIEAFYQESGRAGRNGAPARSVLMYSARDRRRMDYLLQKDATKKAGRKRKQQKQQQQQPAAASSSNGDGAHDGGGDDAVAAAALRAFGGVVELCCSAGCRRARLLQHFGEALQRPGPQPPAAAGAGSSRRSNAGGGARCCDFCDDPGRVAAAVAQLQQAEQQQLMQRRHFRGFQQGQRKRRRRGSGGDGMFGSDGESEDGSSDGSGGGSSGDEGLDEGDPATAAAAAAAAAGGGRRHGGKGAAGGGPASTDAFLAAMLKAEQAHERRAAAGAGSSSKGGKLEHLMAQRQAGAPKDPSGLPDSMRASRRAKLAEVIGGNGSLSGCSAAVAAELAAAYEASAAAACGADAGSHRAAVGGLIADARDARGWLGLPQLQLLRGAALAAALEQGVQRAVARAAKAGEAAAVAQDLRRLGRLAVTADALEATGVAGAVKKLRKHADPGVAAAAAGAIDAWRKAVTEGS